MLHNSGMCICVCLLDTHFTVHHGWWQDVPTLWPQAGCTSTQTHLPVEPSGWSRLYPSTLSSLPTTCWMTTDMSVNVFNVTPRCLLILRMGKKTNIKPRAKIVFIISTHTNERFLDVLGVFSLSPFWSDDIELHASLPATLPCGIRGSCPEQSLKCSQELLLLCLPRDALHGCHCLSEPSGKKAGGSTVQTKYCTSQLHICLRYLYQEKVWHHPSIIFLSDHPAKNC